jgi:hypothetical protein
MELVVSCKNQAVEQFENVQTKFLLMLKIMENAPKTSIRYLSQQINIFVGTTHIKAALHQGNN